MSEDKIKPRIIKEDDSEEKTKKEKSNRELRREKAMLKAKIKSRAKLIFYTLLIVGVVVAAVIFSIFTFFKVNKVNIQGSNIYTSEEIMETAGINIGDSLVFLDLKNAEKRLESELLYVEDVSLNRSIPYTLNIKITQAVPTYSVEYRGKYIYVSSKGKILEISSNVMAGTMKVSGGEVSEKDGILSFSDEKVNSAFNELIAAIEETGTAGIDYIDISNVFEITAEYDGRVRMKFGTSQDLTYKMKFAINIINNENGIAPDESGILDLSLARETNKSYFTPDIYSNGGEGTISEFTPSEEITTRGEDIPEP